MKKIILSIAMVAMMGGAAVAAPVCSQANIAVCASEGNEALLSQYETLTTKFIRLCKKAAQGDMDAAKQAQEVAAKLEKVHEKLSRANLSASEMQKFADITAKAQKAAANM